MHLQSREPALNWRSLTLARDRTAHHGSESGDLAGLDYSNTAYVFKNISRKLLQSFCMLPTVQARIQ
jgi:hypothetical protein